MRSVEEYLAQARQYSPIVLPDEDDDEGFVARAVDFPHAVGAGTTRDEAAEELVRGIAAMLEHADVLGVAVPQPMRGYSKPLSVRLPRTLYLALSQRAELEGISLNATVAYLLTQALALEPATRPSR